MNALSIGESAADNQDFMRKAEAGKNATRPYGTISLCIDYCNSVTASDAASSERAEDDVISHALKYFTSNANIQNHDTTITGAGPRVNGAQRSENVNVNVNMQNVGVGEVSVTRIPQISPTLCLVDFPRVTAS